MKKVFVGLFSSIAGLCMVLQWIIGILVHCYATYIAYTFSGIMSVIITFIFPGVSALFWAYDIGSNTGIIFNWITVGIILWVFLWIPIIISVAFASALDDKN